MTMSDDGQPSDSDKLILRKPSADDGAALFQLIASCKPLDENSRYCNLLQCSHFADTACAAQLDGELVGFVSGYRLPERPQTFFLWQVAVAQAGRGRGLARRMIEAILSRPGNQDINHLETTITPDNEASWALFRSFARAVGAPLKHAVHFERERHFAGVHEDEHLLQIGPFSRINQ